MTSEWNNLAYYWSLLDDEFPAHYREQHEVRYRILVRYDYIVPENEIPESIKKMYNHYCYYDNETYIIILTSEVNFELFRLLNELEPTVRFIQSYKTYVQVVKLIIETKIDYERRRRDRVIYEIAWLMLATTLAFFALLMLFSGLLGLHNFDS